MDTKTIIITVIIVIILLSSCSWFLSRETFEHMVNITPLEGDPKWAKNPTCKYVMSETTKKVMTDNNIKEDNNNWDVYMPCTYNSIQKEINEMTPINKNQRFFIINNADELTGKNTVWANLVTTYGRDGASELMPRTYLLNNSADMIMFQNDFSSKKLYILKKNIQRQTGLKISNDLAEILKASNEGYVVVQELLQKPYIIDNRKINMRFYVLIVCRNNEVSAYVHKRGFMYYTKEAFVKNSTSEGPNITTGYIDRSVYAVNPLTHDDFRNYLDDPKRTITEYENEIISQGHVLSVEVFNRIYKLLATVVKGVKHNICKGSHLQNNITFQLFGADIDVGYKLTPRLMEINKGPDMGSKDKRDGALKYGVMTDVFKVIKVVKGDAHDFIKIYDEL